MFKISGRWEATNFPTARYNNRPQSMEVSIMVAVSTLSWEEVSSPDFGSSARRAWREAVAEVAVKAKETLPECNGRIDSAGQIVLAGDVELLPDGKGQIANQSKGTTA